MRAIIPKKNQNIPLLGATLGALGVNNSLETMSKGGVAEKEHTRGGGGVSDWVRRQPTRRSCRGGAVAKKRNLGKQTGHEAKESTLGSTGSDMLSQEFLSNHRQGKSWIVPD